MTQGTFDPTLFGLGPKPRRRRPREVVHVHRDLDTLTPRRVDRARGSDLSNAQRAARAWSWPGEAANDHGLATENVHRFLARVARWSRR